MSDPCGIWLLDKTIPSDPMQACDLIRGVVERLESAAWDPEALFAVHMALEEAVMNAIKHGNQRDVKKKVFIRINCAQDELSICVRDEGSGFSPEDLPDPTADENLENSSGRGVLLIREFMDEVSYNDPGNEITMKKRKQP